MGFTTNEVDIMRAIFKQLEPAMTESVQLYKIDQDRRTGCTFVINDKWKKPICIFQNFTPLSPYRMKLLMRISKKVPYPIHIKQPYDDIMTIGWKYQK